MVEAQRLSDVERLRRERDDAQPLDVEATYVDEQVIRNQEAQAPEPQLA